MRKHTIVFLILACLILILPSFALANTNEPVLKMEELSIQIMPEYAFHPEEKSIDKPPLLVGLHGTFINASEKPQKGQIEIPLPMKGKDFKIGYVADYNRDQTNMFEIEYELDKNKGTISWTTTEEVQPGELYKFVIEYYTNDIKVNEENRTLSYKFESFAHIGMVRVLFLEPLKTESFSLSPAADSHQENGYGMNMFIYQYQGMKPGEVKEYTLKYKRTETKTTMDIMNEMGNQSTAKGVEKENNTLPVAVIFSVISVICVVFAVVIIFILKNKSNRKNVKNNQQKQKVDIGQAELERKKKRLRGMLLDGSITEEEYEELLQKLTN